MGGGIGYHTILIIFPVYAKVLERFVRSEPIKFSLALVVLKIFT